MENIDSIKDRIAKMAQSLPMDADPLAEARAEVKFETIYEERHVV